MLLALGLAGRFAAGALFIFNIIAVLSYPALNAAGIEQHQVWGIMLLVTLLHGTGTGSPSLLLDCHQVARVIAGPEIQDSEDE